MIKICTRDTNMSNDIYSDHYLWTLYTLLLDYYYYFFFKDNHNLLKVILNCKKKTMLRRL